ncbi:uncharacterized protein LOC127278370 [Leptopilina boulardi]|uniref:uncharacterized protein LOC127278370 n=1 Tax=Leptopilina boulardi TaxID=63433 RepID=UPI0021F56C1E|nr:uncharacterized protein LOC127278370 [Leptopilina boulardi]XP_051156032.1 uncharacterized protein LOC127278370 [Leptopilina boulardi]XP_051156033.1 uncharacterized protein LOC127278370 [Leptopilina boulardi]
MTMKFVENVLQSSSTPSPMVPTTMVSTMVPTTSVATIVTSSISTNVTTTIPITSTTNALHKSGDTSSSQLREIETNCLLPVQSETLKNVSSEPPMISFTTTIPTSSTSPDTSIITNTNRRSIPPITSQILKGNNYHITSSEMNSLASSLKKARKYVIKYSKSKDIEKQKLTAELEGINNFIISTRSKMSQLQATLINDELNNIMKKRRKIHLKNSSQTEKETIPTGCFLIFLITIMLLRMILDIASGVLVSQYRLIPLTMVILGVNILGFVFTGFIIVSTLSESKQRKFEIIFCMIWTMLYGVTTIMVTARLSQAPITIKIFGFTSMITCIIQGCLKFYFNYNNSKRTKRRRQSCNDISIINKHDTWNKNVSTSKCESSNENSGDNKLLSNSVIVQSPNNHLDPRINAIQILETTINTFLIEINGIDYRNQTRFNSAENISYTNQQGVSNTTNYSTYNSSYDSFFCCYSSSNPDCDCLPFLYCYGNNGCCESNDNDVDCCDGDCCDCTGCCEGPDDCCCADCGDFCTPDGADCNECCF